MSVIVNSSLLSLILSNPVTLGAAAITLRYITLLGIVAGIDIRRGSDGRRLAIVAGSKLGSVRFVYMAHRTTRGRQWYALQGSESGEARLAESSVDWTSDDSITSTTAVAGFVDYFDRHAVFASVSITPRDITAQIDGADPVVVPFGSPDLPVIEAPADMPAAAGIFSS